MRALLGGEAEELFAALEEPREPAVRLNALRGDPGRLAPLLPWPRAPVPWCPAGRLVNAASASVADHPLNDAGVYYQQDPAAMAAAEALDPRPGELVVDLAAAPGGKATHLAALAGAAALVVANDVDARRARALLSNVERLGVTGAAVTSSAPGRLAGALGGACDAVLLDAPCSGEGMFRRSAAARAAWSETGVGRHAELQRRLIAAAADLLRPGGRLVYSTCTFDPRENEEVVLWLLARRPDLELEPLDLAGAEDAARFGLPGAARLWPHRAVGDGHFVARLRRYEGAPAGPGARRPGDGREGSRVRGAARRGRLVEGAPDDATQDAWASFAAERLTPEWRERASGGRLARFGERLLLLPEGFAPLPGVHVLRAGLHVADARSAGGTVELAPAHALAMAAGFAERGWAGPRLEVGGDDASLAAFLEGGALAAPGVPDGQALVTWRGFALGWADCRRGSARSLLPRGLRRKTRAAHALG
jgi:NOL1/NOP2/sun family putative RNA methylase